MSGCFHIPSCLALCDSFNRLIEQWRFPFPSACLLLCKHYHQLCYHPWCNLTMQINTVSSSSLMFYAFLRITYHLCPTLLLGQCVRYDLTHFPSETWAVPWSHALRTCAEKRALGWFLCCDGRDQPSRWILLLGGWLPGRITSECVLFCTRAPSIVLHLLKLRSILYKI